MIAVSRIVGEGFDLSNGQETPKGLVLTNGIREITIQVDDAVIEEVVRMSVEAAEQALGAHSVGAKVISSTEKPPEHIEEPAFGQPSLVASVPQEEDPVLDQVSSELIAGEEYDDPSTGVASI